MRSEFVFYSLLSHFCDTLGFVTNWHEDPDELKYRRKNLGLSQKQLADRSGVPREILANIETHRRSLTGEVATKLWHALADCEQGRKTVPLSDLLHAGLTLPFKNREQAEAVATVTADADEVTYRGTLEVLLVDVEAEIAAHKAALAELQDRRGRIKQKLDHAERNEITC